jgi:hypothetical protein
MQAKSFFAVLIESRKQEEQRNAEMYMELCDVNLISVGGAKYAEELKACYLARITGGSWKRGVAVKMEPDDPRAKSFLDGVFKQKSKLEGLSGRR